MEDQGEWGRGVGDGRWAGFASDELPVSALNGKCDKKMRNGSIIIFSLLTESEKPV